MADARVVAGVVARVVGERALRRALASIAGCALVFALACSAHAAPPGKPLAAGPVAAPRVSFEIALFFAPDAGRDAETVVAHVLAKDFAGLERVEKVAPRASRPQVAARVVPVGKDFRPPDANALRLFGRGLAPEQAKDVQRADRALVLVFAHDQAVVWDAYRRALRLASRLARETRGILWDAETREAFSADAWDAERIAAWTGSVPDLSRHIVLHAYRNGELMRAVSLGMVKFGLPDIVVNDFAGSNRAAMSSLIQVLAQALAEGAAVGRDGELTLDFAQIRNAEVRKRAHDRLLPRAAAVALLTLREGRSEPGDPDNRLAEIAFDRYPGPDLQARQERLVTTLFGIRDDVTSINHDQAILDASRRARARLPALREAFNRGLAPGELVLVKAPFRTTSGGREWMWVEVVRWSGGSIRGTLQNQPQSVPNLRAGQMVEVAEADVFDYLRRRADGTTEGNETGALIERAGQARR